MRPNPREECRIRAPQPMRPEAVGQRNHGSLGYARDLATVWLESAPCPLVSGLVRRGGSYGVPPKRGLLAKRHCRGGGKEQKWHPCPTLPLSSIDDLVVLRRPRHRQQVIARQRGENLVRRAPLLVDEL